jgi:hypothetical protein
MAEDDAGSARPRISRMPQMSQMTVYQFWGQPLTLQPRTDLVFDPRLWFLKPGIQAICAIAEIADGELYGR